MDPPTIPRPMPGDPAPPPPEDVDPRLVEGLELFNAGEWFECHEAWELLWRDTPGPGRELYRGLIMAAVALEHWRRGNPKGARQMWQKARPRLARFAPDADGLDLGTFRDRLDGVMAPLGDDAHPGRADTAPPAPTPRDVPTLRFLPPRLRPKR